jgi:hypothetical protein
MTVLVCMSHTMWSCSMLRVTAAVTMVGCLLSTLTYQGQQRACQLRCLKP